MKNPVIIKSFPNGLSIYLDEEMLDKEGMTCPNCGTELEFDFDCDCDDCCDDDCCDCDSDKE